MHQSRDPTVSAISGGGDHHPAVAVADQRRAGDVGAIEEPQYVVGVRVVHGWSWPRSLGAVGAGVALLVAIVAAFAFVV